VPFDYTLADLVDLERYPIHDLDGAGRKVVEEGRAQLDAQAMCHLPGFLRDDVVKAVLDEIAPLREATYWMDVPRRAYSWRNPDEYPDTPVVGRTNDNRIGTITGDAFGRASAFMSLFRQPALTELIRRIGISNGHSVSKAKYRMVTGRAWIAQLEAAQIDGIASARSTAVGCFSMIARSPTSSQIPVATVAITPTTMQATRAVARIFKRSSGRFPSRKIHDCGSPRLANSSGIVATRTR
jgi:hypothetical protein